ncbi:MAG: GAF domain-containing protein [Acidobacteria bacterium]|nr:GAF domain-containing protein [Acidobacteriota bacterium]
MTVNFTKELFVRSVISLYRESVISRFLGWVKVGGKYPFDDRVKDLRGRPLGMFFYNQRATFFFFGFLYLLLLAALAWLVPSANAEMKKTVWVLAGFWSAGAVMTVLLHPLFRRRLSDWAMHSVEGEFPPMFDAYFVLDYALVFLLVVVGRATGLKLDGFIFLLFANTVVYSTYIRGWHFFPRVLAVLVSLVIIAALLSTGIDIALTEPRWFYSLLQLGPILGTLLGSVLLVSMISLLRSLEKGVTQMRLELLGRCQIALSGPVVEPGPDVPDGERGRAITRQFHERVQHMLADLCSIGEPFWYDAACLWLIVEHRDRDEVFLPGPCHNFDEAEINDEGIDCSSGFLGYEDLEMITSTRYHSGRGQSIPPSFRSDVDAPAAFIPLYRIERRAGARGDVAAADGGAAAPAQRRRIGVLSLYGERGGPPLQRQEEFFLRSLGSILTGAMEQWEARYDDFPQKELDDLLACETLQEVFDRTALIMQNYLMASGCMVVFRPDPRRRPMEIRAYRGFDHTILRSAYEVGVGLTGRCAEEGMPFRRDNARKHARDFEPTLFRNMERSLGEKIHSWMAVPIGPRDRNYGVIKVVNRKSYCGWFSEDDQRLAQSLAFRLRVVVEKFLQLEELRVATDKARRHSEAASREQQKAERMAALRQKELMIITHQLQGPLSSVVGAITSLQGQGLPRLLRENLDYVHDLVEDCLALCNGTSTSFALDAGRRTTFGVEELDAQAEMEMLSRRLQKTNARHDLNFYCPKVADFPVLRMNRDVFISVMYSLIHNAMKYADDHSEVSLICTYADGAPVLEVHSFGEPIPLAEADDIFELFRRGSVVERTGRHHSGVGLGLWVARLLMSAVGGGLTVRLSPSAPRLAIFIVHLPPSAGAPAETIRGGRTLLSSAESERGRD